MTNQIATADNTITSAEFYKYTLAWESLIKSPPPTDKTIKVASLQDHFQFTDNTWIYSINFKKEAIHRLLSSVGVNQIMAKFAIKDNLFTIILFGTNDQGTRSSGYYLGTPTNNQVNFKDDHKNNNGNNTGYISDELAETWIKNWYGIVDSREIDVDLLDTTYGKLLGYNYNMMDFMQTLYPPDKSLTINNGVNIFLASHDHHSNEFEYSGKVVYTFGMVLSGVPPLIYTTTEFDNTDTQATIEVTSFYDLSAPSPPAT